MSAFYINYALYVAIFSLFVRCRTALKMRHQGDCAEEIFPSLLLQSYKDYSLLYIMLGEISFLSVAVLIFYCFYKKIIQNVSLKVTQKCFLTDPEVRLPKCVLFG